MMRGILLREFGPVEKQEITELPEPQPAEREVLVEIHAIGVNLPDNLMLEGKYQVRPELPFVPGRDAAGIVRKTGSKVTRVKPGDRVAIQVQKGAFATHAIAPEARVFPIPEKMSFVDAAALVTSYNTAYVAAVIRAQVKAGQSAVVTGAAGGVGLALVQLLKALGVKVIAAVSTEAKERLARESGADQCVPSVMDNLRDDFKERVFAANGGKPVDVVFDTVGGELFEAALRALGFDGKMIVIGFASTVIPAPRVHTLLYKNLSIIGAPLDIHFAERPAQMQEGVAQIHRWYLEGKVRPQVTQVLPFERFKDAFIAFRTRKAEGKIVLAVK
jgi:NADPH2:quinone reductase